MFRAKKLILISLTVFVLMSGFSHGAHAQSVYGKCASVECIEDDEDSYPVAVLPPGVTDLLLKATPLSQAQANAWFQLLASRKDIPFDYPDDGCYARAEKMAKIMEAHNVVSLKLFINADDIQIPFVIHTPNAPGGVVGWSYHVAPAVLVVDKSGSQLEVLDPSLYQAPVSADEWLRAIGTSSGPNGHYHWLYKTRFAYIPTETFFPYFADADLKEMDATNAKNLANAAARHHR